MSSEIEFGVSIALDPRCTDRAIWQPHSCSFEDSLGDCLKANFELYFPSKPNSLVATVLLPVHSSISLGLRTEYRERRERQILDMSLGARNAGTGQIR